MATVVRMACARNCCSALRAFDVMFMLLLL